MGGGGVPPPYSRLTYPFVHRHVTNRVTPNGVGLPPGWQSRHCQRRHAALASPYGRGAQCAHWAERAFLYRNSPLSRLRRQLSQRESQVGGAFRSWVRFGWVHPFRKVSPFLIRPGFAGPPSPRGKDFLSVNYQVTNWGTAGGYSRGRRGRAPALRKVRPFYPKLLRCNEPGDPQRWWSTTRVTGSH